MAVEQVVGLVGVLAGILTSVFSYRQSTRAARQTESLEKAKIDAEAYERAQSITEKSVARLQEDLARERAENERLRRRLSELEAETVTLRAEIARLTSRMDKYDGGTG